MKACKKKMLIVLFLVATSATAFSQILFSTAPGKLNTGGTFDIMHYDVESAKTSLVLKGTVRGRGEYNVVTSPDNSKIIFNTYRFQGWKLGLGDYKNGAITNVRRLTDRNNYEYTPKYSPDGNHIVYQEYSWSSRDSDLFISDREGKNGYGIVQHSGEDCTPDWTKNGQSIVFASSRESNFDIYIKSIASQQLTQLTKNKSHEFACSVSRDDDKIAFLSDREGSLHLYSMDLNGEGIKKLSQDLKSDTFDEQHFWAYSTCWSPDGKKIVFNVLMNGSSEIFIVNNDGTDLLRVTNNRNSDVNPFWTNNK